MPPTSPPADRAYSPWIVRLLIGLGGLVIGVWLYATPPGILGRADAVGYAICHRITDRSFHIHDRPMPLCARCTGIYLGVMVGLAAFIARGHSRASRLPGVPILGVFMLFGAAYAVDGLNSYLSLFAAYPAPYQPHNTLRLITGLGFGLAMITVVLPVFNAVMWRVPREQAPVATLRELAGLIVLAGAAGAAVLTGQPAILAAAGVISAAGVVLMFMIIGSVAFVTVLRRENTATRWSHLAIPALVGLVFAIGVIGGIDLVRYALTGTWDGFNFL